MRLLIAFARAYPWRSLATLAALLVAGLLEGIGLSTLLPVLSAAVGGEGGGTGLLALVPEALAAAGIAPGIGPLLAVLVVGIALKSALVLVAQRQVGYTIARIATDLRLALIRALLAARWDYHLRQPIGALANAAGTEAIRASYAYYHGARAAAYAVQAAVYAAVAVAVSPLAALAALAAAAIVLPAFNRLVRATRRAGARQTRLLKSLLARLADTLASVKPLKAMAREARIAPLLEEETRDLNAALRREVLSKETMRAVQEPVIAAFIAIGLYAALVGFALSPAVVLALAFLLARGLYQLGMVQRMYQHTVNDESAYWSLQEAIDAARAAREDTGGGRVPALERELVLEDLCLRYGGRAVLEGASLVVPAGAFVGIVGPSGAGKTTVVDVIAGLVRPERGRVLVDGVPLELLDLTRWRRMIGYVPQETGLLHDTVRNNVTLGDPDIDEAAAREALVAAGAWEFVAALPEGLDSPVGERGARLSGGQRQRIVIARALAHRPRLLILDEATSALDPESEVAVCRALRALPWVPTVIAISHRGLIAEVADRVYRLQGGRFAPMEPAPSATAGGRG